MLLGTLGASLLGNMLANKGKIRAGYGSKGKGIIRAGYGSEKKFNSTPSFNKLGQTLASIIRMNLDLMEFILEIIYDLSNKKRMGHM